ncbi:uncharacterized protein C8Q71DRAFT_463987 [Rhodofomes roseus]|uniref:DUF6532 domain-containing protein n=1 Tax=Rhodofomes roseus TaxID=34475 RepID=A0ABQ8KN26_9APHY|nr:uncharacterized protein C8Q71DRAFT_463987 [Rhodofomes roseus]KAH9839824.1 hypothetical protein C8Q71DRAFT_463987 [Rhodofomes roseus]
MTEALLQGSHTAHEHAGVRKNEITRKQQLDAASESRRKVDYDTPIEEPNDEESDGPGISLSDEHTDPLSEEPMKGFLKQARRELELYIAVVDAWPGYTQYGRMDVTVKIINTTYEKYTIYRNERFRTLFAPLWADENISTRMVGYIYMAASFLRHQLKQTAIQVVQKAYTRIDTGPDGTRLDGLSEHRMSRSARAARIVFLRAGDTFHHGDVDIPFQDTVDSSLWKVDLTKPYHNQIIGQIIAHQWFLKRDPEALQKEDRDHFDLDKPLSSNMIALVCSSVNTCRP